MKLQSDLLVNSYRILLVDVMYWYRMCRPSEVSWFMTSTPKIIEVLDFTSCGLLLTAGPAEQGTGTLLKSRYNPIQVNECRVPDGNVADFAAGILQEDVEDGRGEGAEDRGGKEEGEEEEEEGEEWQTSRWEGVEGEEVRYTSTPVRLGTPQDTPTEVMTSFSIVINPVTSGGVDSPDAVHTQVRKGCAAQHLLGRILGLVQLVKTKSLARCKYTRQSTSG